MNNDITNNDINYTRNRFRHKIIPLLKQEDKFIHSKKHGDGIFYLNNELIYEGTWKFDKPCIFDRSLDELFSIKL